MATQLIVYKTADKTIWGYVKDLDGSDYIWDNESTYSADDYIQVDGIKRLVGIGDGIEVRDFTGSLPGTFFTKLDGDYTDPDPENWEEPDRGFHKFDATFANIVET